MLAGSLDRSLLPLVQGDLGLHRKVHVEQEARPAAVDQLLSDRLGLEPLLLEGPS